MPHVFGNLLEYVIQGVNPLQLESEMNSDLFILKWVLNFVCDF